MIMGFNKLEIADILIDWIGALPRRFAGAGGSPRRSTTADCTPLRGYFCALSPVQQNKF